MRSSWCIEVVLAGVDLGLDRRFGQRHVDDLVQLVDQLVAGLGALLVAAHPGEPLAQIGLQLVEGVELAGRGGELVVQLRELLLLDADDLHRDVGGLPGEVAQLQLGRKRALVALAGPADGVVQSLDQVVRSRPRTTCPLDSESGTGSPSMVADRSSVR